MGIEPHPTEAGAAPMTIERVSRSEVARLLTCGHSPASIAAAYGMSAGDMRRLVKRVAA